MDTSVDNQKEQGHEAPLVSIIMPVYNGASSVAWAISSVAKQSFSDYELIVIDDGSTDGTESVVKTAAASDSRIIYAKNENNLGIQISLNKGLEMARGKYIARIDADDRWIEGDKLEKQVEFMDKNPDYVLLGTGSVVVNEMGDEIFRILEPTDDRTIRKMILSKNCFLHASILASKAAMMKVGGYDTSLECRHIEDYDLWLKLGRVGKFANLSTCSMQYTVSDTQISALHRIAQFRKNIYLMHEYWNDYGGHLAAWIRNYTRLLIYGYLRLDVLRRLTSKIYKKKYSE